jgi:predicted DNA-binding transcriptional regulator AlpA
VVRTAAQVAAPEVPTALRLLTVRQVCACIGVSRTAFWRIRREDTSFPKAIMLGAFSPRFRLVDLERWLVDRQQKSTGAAV